MFVGSKRYWDRGSKGVKPLFLLFVTNLGQTLGSLKPQGYKLSQRCQNMHVNVTKLNILVKKLNTTVISSERN